MEKRNTNKRPEWKIIVGLGNPDEKYTQTYHNAGWLSIEIIAAGLPKKADSRKNGLFLYRKTNGAVLVKSLVYMNESGKAVAAAIKYFSGKENRICPENILVIHDDSDISIGEYKVSFGRGSAGHKGAQSIIDCLGTKNFWRFRVGIRKGPKLKAGAFVLRKMTVADRQTIRKTIEKFGREYGLFLDFKA